MRRLDSMGKASCLRETCRVSVTHKDFPAGLVWFAHELLLRVARGILRGTPNSLSRGLRGLAPGIEEPPNVPHERSAASPLRCTSWRLWHLQQCTPSGGTRRSPPTPSSAHAPPVANSSDSPKKSSQLHMRPAAPHCSHHHTTLRAPAKQTPDGQRGKTVVRRRG